MFTDILENFASVCEAADEEEAMVAAVMNANSRTLDRQLPAPHGGSVPGRRYYRRDRGAAEARYRSMYWGPNPRYGPEIFERRHRIPRDLMQFLHDDLLAQGLLVQSQDARGCPGVSVLMQIAIALRVLGKGFAYDSFDECFDVAESTVCAIFARFCRAVVARYGDHYLRTPNEDELRELLTLAEARGVPGCWGSIDGTPWEWDNCPVVERGSYKGRHDRPSIVLEAVVDGNLRIWHAFFGVPGVNNDIAVLERSPFFDYYTDASSLLRRSVPLLGGRELDTLYVLGDGIYHHISLIATQISGARTREEHYYNVRQSAIRKDVERAFGVMKARWWIIKYPSRFLSPSIMHDIMYTCIILHNMIIVHRQGRPLLPPLPPPPVLYPWAERSRLHAHFHRAGGGATLRLTLAAHMWERRHQLREELA
eukprot:GHVU01036066.1.p1 GENE.GHVU01036066.1~~GHVU01036066.1.p1  ORF type:complete len:424 (+),score=44.27 GHVU01036066.1:254-1525(+)